MSALELGAAAPDWSLPDSHSETVSLHDFAGQKLIMYFYPAAMTPGCTAQACDFRDNLATFTSQGYAVVGVSPDTVQKLTRFADQESLSYPLLSDPDKGVLTAYGAYGEKSLYGKTVVGVIRSTVVIDERSRVILAKHNVKAAGHVAMLSKALELTST